MNDSDCVMYGTLVYIFCPPSAIHTRYPALTDIRRLRRHLRQLSKELSTWSRISKQGGSYYHPQFEGSGPFLEILESMECNRMRFVSEYSWLYLVIRIWVRVKG
ncbi:hypothetical protein JTB14_037809 [Gonioctena quinquepunctata]|nr:hypothetical protein JTB14_037809 [Gonioctena quinquepunctata]